jgi:c-di-GMP-binding flagellar brake protein YcgR
VNSQDVFAVLFGRPGGDPEQDDEVRAEGREYLEVPLLLYESTCPKNRGWVHNISEHGLGVVGVEAKINEKKKFVITADELPDVTPCEVEAVCCWIKKQALGNELDAGFEIVQISEENWEKLREMVPTLEVDEKLRSDERLCLDPPLSVHEADRPEVRGRVQDISDHGLRVVGVRASVGEMKRFVLDVGECLDNHGIEFEAVCRWIKPRDAEIDFDSGFEITAVYGDSFKKIVRLIPKRDPH